MTLALDELRQHIETDLEDDALQRLLDAAYQAIDEYAGVEGDVSEYLRAGYGDLLFLSRRALSITSVIERDVTLAASDYELRPSGLQLRRLTTGTHPSTRWHGRIDVTYTALADDAERDRVAIELCKLDVTHEPGLASQTLGAWSETYQTGTAQTGGYSDQRAAILASLYVGAVMMR